MEAKDGVASQLWAQRLGSSLDSFVAPRACLRRSLKSRTTSIGTIQAAQSAQAVRNEKQREPLAASIRAAFVPITHTIKITTAE